VATSIHYHLLSHPVTIHPSGRCLEAIAAPNHKRNGHGEHGEQHHLRRQRFMVRSCLSESPSYFDLLRASGAPKSAHNISQHLTTSLLHSHLGVRSTSLTRTHDKKMEHIASYCCVPKSRNWGNPTALPGPARMKCLGSPGARDPQVSCCWQCQTPVKRRLRLHHAPSPYIYTSIIIYHKKNTLLSIMNK